MVSIATINQLVYGFLVNTAGVGESGLGEEAFYRLAEEGVVTYDHAKVNWHAYKVHLSLRVGARTVKSVM